MVTVTGIYNGPGCPSVYKNNGIKTDIEKGAGPRKLVQCLQMHVHACVGVGVMSLCEFARPCVCLFVRDGTCVLMMAILYRLLPCLFSHCCYSWTIPDAS